MSAPTPNRVNIAWCEWNTGYYAAVWDLKQQSWAHVTEQYREKLPATVAAVLWAEARGYEIGDIYYEEMLPSLIRPAEHLPLTDHERRIDERPQTADELAYWIGDQLSEDWAWEHVSGSRTLLVTRNGVDFEVSVKRRREAASEEFLKNLARELRTQDNARTAHPVLGAIHQSLD